MLQYNSSLEKFDTSRQESLQRVGDGVKLRHCTSSKEALVRARRHAHNNFLMNAYIRNGIRVKRQDFIRGILGDIKIYIKILDETQVSDLAIKYSSSEMRRKLLGNSELISPSTVTPFSAVQRSGKKYSTSKTLACCAKISTAVLWNEFAESHTYLQNYHHQRASPIRRPPVSTAGSMCNIFFRWPSSWRLNTILGREMTPSFQAQSKVFQFYRFTTEAKYPHQSAT